MALYTKMCETKKENNFINLILNLLDILIIIIIIIKECTVKIPTIYYFTY